MHGVGGDGDDGQAVQLGHGADDPGGLIAVHDRHLHVHEYEIEVFPALGPHAQRVQSLLAVADDGQLYARVLEEGFHDFLIGGVILRHKDADVVEERRFHGRWQGVEPSRIGYQTGLVE